jgi:anti-sigma factor RsiW
MNCCEFREKYSDFADGLLPSRQRSEAGAHLGTCAACRRFDAALRAGLDALRALPSVGVSRGFGPRLRQRLRGEFAVRVPLMARWSGASATLLLVATIGFLGWDLLESRAAHRGRAAWPAPAWSPSPAPLAALGAGPGYASPPRYSADPRFDAFHPLNSILVTEEANPAVGGGRFRFDLPAVWGGP